MEFKLASEAAILSTRRRSVVLMAKVERELDDSATGLVLDFEGVRYISCPFADEFLGAMIGQARYKGLGSPALVNLTPAVASMLAAGLSERRLAALKIDPSALP